MKVKWLEWLWAWWIAPRQHSKAEEYRLPGGGTGRDGTRGTTVWYFKPSRWFYVCFATDLKEQMVARLCDDYG